MPAQGKKASGSKGGAAPKKAAQGAQAEKRLDPHSGKTLTFSELETMYRGKYGKAEIDQYWKHECKVVKAKAEAETTKPKEDAEQKAKEEAEAKAKNEADVKAKAEEVQAKAKEAEDSGAKAKEEAEAKAKADAEARAKEDAEAKAREEAEEKAKEEAETKAKEEADIKAKKEAEQKAKEEAELKAKEMAEAKAKEEVESKAREEEAAAKDSEDAERKAKEESAGDEPLSRESTRSPSATEMVGSSVSVKCETSFGECVAMVGSAQALGAWDPSKALRLTTDASSYPTWTAQLPECPAAGMEFKFVILQGDGSAKWEPIPGNREWPNHNLSGGPVGVSARFGEEPMTTSTSQ